MLIILLMTQACIWAVTVFIDFASHFVYAHLMQELTRESTLEAKHAFEYHANSRGVLISHYHADNGRFAEKIWIEDYKKSAQHITFCGVGAHH